MGDDVLGPGVGSLTEPEWTAQACSECGHEPVSGLCPGCGVTWWPEDDDIMAAVRAVARGE